MAAQAEADREVRAKVIAGEGEHKASKALRNAADSTAALQVWLVINVNIFLLKLESWNPSLIAQLLSIIASYFQGIWAQMRLGINMLVAGIKLKIHSKFLAFQLIFLAYTVNVCM